MFLLNVADFVVNMVTVSSTVAGSPVLHQYSCLLKQDSGYLDPFVTLYIHHLMIRITSLMHL